MDRQLSRDAPVAGVDLERGTANVGSRPVSSVERAEASEDPRFDRTGLRMLAAFDARRVVPVLIVTCRPSFVYLFVNLCVIVRSGGETGREPSRHRGSQRRAGPAIQEGSSAAWASSGPDSEAGGAPPPCQRLGPP